MFTIVAYLKYAKIGNMAIYLVGENTDKDRAYYAHRTGRLVQLFSGVYADSAEDADAVVLRYAVRIARYLYPRAYLSSVSAAQLGPARDGRLFLSGRRKQRTRIWALEIIQNEAPPHPSLVSAAIDDGMGEFHVEASSPRQQFLEAFRLRSEHASAIDFDLRETLAKRLSEEFGNARGAADALWALARENGWHREAEHAERWLLRGAAEVPPSAGLLDLIVAWHGTQIGRLNHNGFEWRWTPVDYDGPVLVRQTTPGELPRFILSLLPEGWLQRVFNDRDDRQTLRSGRRYLSNITIAERTSEIAALPGDVLIGRLGDWTDGGRFTGEYAGPHKGEIEEQFENQLAKLFAQRETPRLSGVQIKAPMHLDAHGKLTPSIHDGFTHILKPGGTGGFEALPAIEWLCLALGSAAGFEVPAYALLSMPDGMPPALVVERFDIRTSKDDRRLLAMEDLTSVLDLPQTAKYGATIEQVARAVRPLSTAPDEDIGTLFKRALFAWLIADGDMHLKNLALLKIAEKGARSFSRVRMAPLYDAVTTRVFPGLGQDRMALKLHGKDSRLRRKDFQALAATIGLQRSRADQVIDDTLAKLDGALDRVTLPSLTHYSLNGRDAANRALDLCRERIATFR